MKDVLTKKTTWSAIGAIAAQILAIAGVQPEIARAVSEMLIGLSFIFARSAISDIEKGR